MGVMEAERAFSLNVIGAFADLVSGRIDAAITEVLGSRGETGAALITMLHEPGLNIKHLSATLGIRSPSAVELVDRLCREGLVARDSAPDRRQVRLRLTAEGTRTAQRILAARETAIRDLTYELSTAQLDALREAAAEVLRCSADSPVSGDRICRRCDEPVCPDEACPVASALCTGRSGE